MDAVEAGAALPPAHAGQIAAFLRDGGWAAVLTGPSRCETRTVLEEALWAVPGLVIRTGNPLSTPLSLSRLMLQVGADPHADDEAGALLDAIVAHAAGQPNAVLSIDDAHTLEPDALQALAQLPLPGSEGSVGVQLVFTGRPALLALLDAAAIRDHARGAVLTITLDETAGPEDAAERADTVVPFAIPRPGAAAVPQPVPPPPPPLVRPVRDQAEPSSMAVPAVPLPPESRAVTSVARQPRPVATMPNRATALAPSTGQPTRAARAVQAPPVARARRTGPLILAASAGLCTGLVAGLAALWLLGVLSLPGLPPSPFAGAPQIAGAAAIVAPAPLETTGAVPVPTTTAPEAAPVLPSATPQPELPPEKPPEGQTPVAAPPPASAPASATPGVPPPPGPSEGRLRRDFDAFVRRSGWNATARTPEAREALFRDYKEWLARHRTGPMPGQPTANAAAPMP